MRHTSFVSFPLPPSNLWLDLSVDQCQARKSKHFLIIPLNECLFASSQQCLTFSLVLEKWHDNFISFHKQIFSTTTCTFTNSSMIKVQTFLFLQKPYFFNFINYDCNLGNKWTNFHLWTSCNFGYNQQTWRLT